MKLKDLARALGMSPSRASRLVARGMPTDVEAARAWRAANVAPYVKTFAAAPSLGAQAAPGVPAPPGVATPPPATAAVDPDVVGLAAERARVARATAERIERENRVALGQLAPIATLELVLGHVARRLAARLDAIVPQLRRTMPELPAAALVQVSAALHEAREDLARVNLGDATDVDELDGDETDDGPPR